MYINNREGYYPENKKAARPKSCKIYSLDRIKRAMENGVKPLPEDEFKRPPIDQTSEPVRDKETLNKIEQYLLNNTRYGERNWLIFILGINLGRRTDDILSLRIGDVFDGRRVVDHLQIIENKTQKPIKIRIAPEIQNVIFNYIMRIPSFTLYDYLFQSQKGGYVSRKRYWEILKKARDDLDLDFRLSPYSTRKTWAYTQYQNNKGVVLEGGYDIVDQLQEMFNHSTRRMTLRYLGISGKNADTLQETNVLGLEVLPNYMTQSNLQDN